MPLGCRSGLGCRKRQQQSSFFFFGLALGLAASRVVPSATDRRVLLQRVTKTYEQQNMSRLWAKLSTICPIPEKKDYKSTWLFWWWYALRRGKMGLCTGRGCLSWKTQCQRPAVVTSMWIEFHQCCRWWGLCVAGEVEWMSASGWIGCLIPRCPYCLVAIPYWWPLNYLGQV